MRTFGFAALVVCVCSSVARAEEPTSGSLTVTLNSEPTGDVPPPVVTYVEDEALALDAAPAGEGAIVVEMPLYAPAEFPLDMSLPPLDLALDGDQDGIWDGYTDESYVAQPSAGYAAYTDFDDLDFTPAEAAAGAPPLPAPWVGGGWGPANTGHAGPPDPYNIYVWNCHSATNLCTLTAPQGEQRGALVCGTGAVNTPAVHSASWGVFNWGGNAWSCIYNWGNACCWQAGVTPPNVAGGDGQRCARWACGDQYNAAQTTTLPAGQMVEIPGYSACVREVTTGRVNKLGVNSDEVSTAMANAPANQASCLACCDRRGNMWNGSGYDRQNLRLDFMNNCRTLCNGFFGNGVTLGAQYGASQCVPSTTTWSWSSRYEQCRGCCLDGAIGGRYPTQDTNSCLAVCSQTYPQ